MPRTSSLTKNPPFFALGVVRDSEGKFLVVQERKHGRRGYALAPLNIVACDDVQLGKEFLKLRGFLGREPEEEHCLMRKGYSN